MMLNFDEIFTDSYERLLDLGEIFFDQFYENFISASTDVRKKFKNTDMQKQKKMLRNSIYHMLEFYINKQDTDYMQKIAGLHSKKDKDISPKFYDLWLEALVATVRDIDPKYERDVGLAWKMVMSTGIMYMKDSYDRDDKQMLHSIFTDSYERLLDLGEIFFDQFYENFISASTDVRKKFKNTDMQKQKKMLRKSIYHMMEFYINKQDTDYMQKIAGLHSKKDKDISPKFYDLWLEALVATVRDIDPKYERDVGLAWKMVMSTGIMYMKDSYDRNDEPDQTLRSKEGSPDDLTTK